MDTRAMKAVSIWRKETKHDLRLALARSTWIPKSAVDRRNNFSPKTLGFPGVMTLYHHALPVFSLFATCRFGRLQFDGKPFEPYSKVCARLERGGGCLQPTFALGFTVAKNLYAHCLRVCSWTAGWPFLFSK